MIDRRYRLLLALSCVLGAPQLPAAEIGIVSTQQLSFGKFVAGNGSVIVNADGMRAATGSVIALGSGPGAAAQFVITGDASTTFSVSLPVDGLVTIANDTRSMPVNGFISSPASTATLSAGGSQVLNVGARLDVSSDQPSGDYSGTFMVVVDYN